MLSNFDKYAPHLHKWVVTGLHWNLPHLFVFRRSGTMLNKAAPSENSGATGRPGARRRSGNTLRASTCSQPFYLFFHFNRHGTIFCCTTGFDLAEDPRGVECLPKTVRESLDLLDHSALPWNSKVYFWVVLCQLYFQTHGPINTHTYTNNYKNNSTVKKDTDTSVSTWMTLVSHST